MHVRLLIAVTFASLPLAACGPTCTTVSAALHDCNAEWQCGGDVYLARCPTPAGSGDTAINPACQCLKNNVAVGTLGTGAYQWCETMDAQEKRSWARAQCSWPLPP